jgi:ABC-type transport system substrate-binding protein
MAAAILVATIPALGQESKSSWKLEKSPIRGIDISARSEIASPQGAGFATFKITYQPGVNPSVIVNLIVESPKRLPNFPFEKYDGPVDMTKNEFIRFEVAPGNHGMTQTMKVMPSGYYGVTPPDAFLFETIDKSVASFLLDVKDGQKLSVMVNGPPSSIQVAFDTAGLKQLLDQAGLKAVPRHNFVRRKK